MESSTETLVEKSLEEPTEEINEFGCEHYRRKSKFVSPCCAKIYTCRFCHDEKEDHEISRKEVVEIICAICDTRQCVQKTCKNCGVKFGKYACLECNLFDDVDKNQFHCNGCGICRVGGADKYFHCEKCNMCLPVRVKTDHRCVENVSHANCPVCLEYIHTSRIPCHIPDCGHLLHKTCFESLLKSGLYACPLCQTSLMDMAELWAHLDNEVARTPMPVEYRDYIVQILCKDCHKKSTVPFHVVGFKCKHCGSYNTTRIAGAERYPRSLLSLIEGRALNNSAVNGVTEEEDAARVATIAVAAAALQSLQENLAALDNVQLNEDSDN